MDPKQLGEHFEALKNIILSRRATCRDRVQVLREQLKAVPKEHDKERYHKKLGLIRATDELKRYNVPITKVAPICILAPEIDRDIRAYYNGRLIQAFLQRLGKRYELLSIEVNPKTFNLEIVYDTPVSRGRFQLTQLFIEGTVFADHRNLIPTYNVKEGALL